MSRSRIKGIAIIAALVAILVVIGATAFEKTVGSKGPSSPSDAAVTEMLTTEINSELAGQGTVATAGCERQAKADTQVGVKAGEYFCLVGVTTTQGDACYALMFALVDNALPSADKVRGQALDVTTCAA